MKKIVQYMYVYYANWKTNNIMFLNALEKLRFLKKFTYYLYLK